MFEGNISILNLRNSQVISVEILLIAININLIAVNINRVNSLLTQFKSNLSFQNNPWTKSIDFKIST